MKLRRVLRFLNHNKRRTIKNVTKTNVISRLEIKFKLIISEELIEREMKMHKPRWFKQNSRKALEKIYDEVSDDKSATSEFVKILEVFVN